MAMSAITVDVDGFDASVIDKDHWEVFAAANSGNRAAVRQVMTGFQLIKGRCKTTDNTAASEVIDLTTKGVTFPAGTKRKIKFKSTAVSDNDTWVQEWEQDVWGNDGTTPKLLGSPKLRKAHGVIAGTAVEYGEIQAQATYSGDTATAVTANSSAGSSLGNNSTNTVTMTHPIARSSPKWFSAQPARAAAAVAGARTVDVVGATSTTATAFISDVATPTAAAPSGTLTVFGFIVPPPSVALVMTSNNLEVHCGHDATDDVYHFVDVEISPLEYHVNVAD
jgi:hypothetical protein